MGRAWFDSLAGHASCLSAVALLVACARQGDSHADLASAHRGDGAVAVEQTGEWRPDGGRGASVVSPDGGSVSGDGGLSERAGADLDAGAADAGTAEGQAVDPIPFRLPKTLALEQYGFDVVDPFPGIRFDQPLSMFETARTIYVAEQGGRIWSFRNDPDATDKTLVLDLSHQTQAGGDGGLLSIAPHPDFDRTDSAHAGEIYLYYLYNIEPVPGNPPPPETESFARLSRVTIPPGEVVADPASETVLIEQLDRHIWHQGSGMFFHPGDGFLYLAIGDEGGGGCVFATCQRIDRSLYGGVLRIDVDMRGGEVSHPIRKAPVDGVTDHYFVPNDNPFVDVPGVLEEFYAIGLRNPHRMTYDPVDGIGWIGDVGQKRAEEINVLSPGANYQWNVMEGDTVRAGWSDPSTEPLGVWTGPAHDHPVNGSFNTIIGGHVYRGDAMPALYGRYVYASHGKSDIWAAEYEILDGHVGITGTRRVLDRSYPRDKRISSLGQGEDGRLYFLTLGEEGRIREIVAVDGVTEQLPAALSETGLFADVRTLAPATSLVPYEVNVPLWSDGARKRRWVHVPQDRTIGFSEDSPWELPEGTVFVKHFEIALDERHPDALTRLETRVLVLTGGRHYGVSYRWHDDQADASPVLSPIDETLTIRRPDGTTREQAYHFPSPSECLECHHRDGPRALGFNLRQLNRANGAAGLAALSERQLLAPAPAFDELSAGSALSPIDDESASPQTRVRSYLDANCSHCHGERTAGGTAWDARYATPLEQQGILDGALLARDGAVGSVRVVVSGKRSESALWLRVASEEAGVRMPPLASSVPDAAFVELLGEWIEGLP